MNNWQQILRDHDPAAERLPADAAARMRDAVVRAARTPPPARSPRGAHLALAAFACLVLMLSILGTRHPGVTAPETGPSAVAGTERRQIQFSTPGGTRIIWELNPDFTLGETIP